MPLSDFIHNMNKEIQEKCSAYLATQNNTDARLQEVDRGAVSPSTHTLQSTSISYEKPIKLAIAEDNQNPHGHCDSKTNKCVSLDLSSQDIPFDNSTCLTCNMIIQRAEFIICSICEVKYHYTCQKLTDGTCRNNRQF